MVVFNTRLNIELDDLRGLFQAEWLYDCSAGLQPVSLHVKTHIINPENAVRFSTPTSPLFLHPLFTSDSWVLIFQVPMTNTCALSRVDSNETMSLVLQKKHWTEVQSEKVQAIALQSVWAVTSSKATKARRILAEESGVTVNALLEGDDTPVFLSYHGLAQDALSTCTTSTYPGYISPRSIGKYLGLVGLYCNQFLIVILTK